MKQEQQREESLSIEQYAGKVTARLAKLVYKITDVLEKKDKELSENGYDLQNHFRQGFMLAETLINNAIDEYKEPSPAQDQEVKTLQEESELINILGINNPWPLVDVLRKLTEMTKLLLDRYNYDQIGWEEVSHCVKRGEEIVKLLESYPVGQPVREKTLQECKDEAARLNQFLNWRNLKHQIPIGAHESFMDVAAELYANQFKSQVLPSYTGVITGEDAERFLERMKNPTPITPEKLAEMKNNYEAIKSKMKPQATQEWISVKDRLPEESGRYWCYVKEIDDLGIGYYQWNCAYNLGENLWSANLKTMCVTHWMPLPEPPIQ